jgi:hypothetical protein
LGNEVEVAVDGFEDEGSEAGQGLDVRAWRLIAKAGPAKQNGIVTQAEPFDNRLPEGAPAAGTGQE